MDRIIRETAANKKPVEYGTSVALIRFDTKKKKVLDPKGNLFDFTNRNAKKYLVFSGVTVEDVVNNCRVSTVKHSIDISVQYQVECIKGAEDKLVHGLHIEENPTSALETIIRHWVTKDFVREKTEGAHEFITNYYSYEKHLVNYLKHKADDELGLRMDAVLKLKEDSDPEPGSIGFDLDVMLKDYNKEIPIKVTAKVIRDESNKELAIINAISKSELEKKVQQLVKDSLMNHTNIHQLLYERRKVAEKCQSELDGMLRGMGRRCIHFSYERKNKTPLPPERFQQDFDNDTFTYRIKDASNFKIDNSIRLSLFDVGLYFSSDVDDLNKTIEAIIRDVVQDVVYSKFYVDLIIDFKDCEKEITRQVTERCRQIGYSVTQHVVLAELKIMKLARNGFEIEIPFLPSDNVKQGKGSPKTDEKKPLPRFGTYATSDANIEFNLEAVVRGALSDLRKLRHYINPQIDFEEILAETIDNEIKHVLHAKHPHQVYMEFYDADEQSGSERIEQVLIESVQNRLEKDFYAQGVSVILKPAPSPLINRLKELRGKTRVFNMKITSFVEAGRLEDVEYEIHFSIKNIVKKRLVYISVQ